MRGPGANDCFGSRPAAAPTRQKRPLCLVRDRKRTGSYRPTQVTATWRPLQPFPANAAVFESGRMIEGRLWPTRAKSGHPPHSITSSAPARPSMAPRVSGSAMGRCRSADHGLSLRHNRPSGQPRRGRNVRREFEAPRVRVTSASILSTTSRTVAAER
jgi:hypothetical protein